MNKTADDTATTTSECACMLGQFRFDALTKLRSAGEFRVEQCRSCGQHWLVVEHDEPAFSRSGEWYRLPLTVQEAETVTADTGFEFFERGPGIGPGDRCTVVRSISKQGSWNLPRGSHSAAPDVVCKPGRVLPRST